MPSEVKKSSAERIIQQAQKWIGYVEKKSNKNLDDFTANAGKNNYTRFNRDYVSVMKGHSYPGSINMQWCAAFVSCMFMYEFGVDAARELLCGDLHCYTPAGAKYFKNKGRYTKRKNADPQPGDVVFFYSSSKGRIGHVGIVTKVDGSKVYTIEGNTSGGSKLVTNGGAVWNKSYKKTSTYIDGYGRPDYADVIVPETPPDNWVKEYQLGDRTLEKNMTGADVKELQSMLIALGYDLGDWGADGDFGSDTKSAVKQFQKDYHLVVDGIAGPDTLEALLEASSRNDPESGEAEGPVEEEEPDGTLAEVGDIDEKEEPLEGDGRVVLVSSGNTVNVRDQPNTEGKILGVARRGESFPYRGETSEAGWHSISFQDSAGWISGKYTTLTGEKLDLETPSQSGSTQEYAVDALDLSSWNSAQAGKIDWISIRDNVGFLILRAGITRLETKPLGVGPDEYFKKWAGKCNEVGIPFWAYYYSQGKTAEKAREEAEYLYNIASPFNPVGYVLDCEEKNIKVKAFFDRLYELGAKKTMLYIGHNWYPVYDLAVDEDGFVKCCDAVWISRYGKNDGTANDKYMPIYACDLWQYSSVYACAWIPDKSLDVNKITGQRRTLAWFRGEE